MRTEFPDAHESGHFPEWPPGAAAEATDEARTLSWYDGTYRYTVSTITPNPLSDQERSKIAGGLVGKAS
ncbi:hypothetical protein LN042_08830 [Kitasatospora sp. RB6PN24]|uniref:hypothetical protein n=1 Tax=Kitasatospora humi TaxID=2893891 RepID=UPI001E487E4D|nr:hypothetical protein [Kitasatospora humi]MCC9307203.1 hypothetical protein [Kitasatospora humi]